MNKTTMFLLGTAATLVLLVVISGAQSTSTGISQSPAQAENAQINTTLALPDLVVSSVSYNAATTYKNSSGVMYVITLKNQGGQYVLPANTHLILSKQGEDVAMPVSDITLGTTVTLATGSSYAVSGIIGATNSCLSFTGLVSLVATVDSTNVIPESNETNNTINTSYTCTLTPQLNPITVDPNPVTVYNPYSNPQINPITVDPNPVQVYNPYNTNPQIGPINVDPNPVVVYNPYAVNQNIQIDPTTINAIPIYNPYVSPNIQIDPNNIHAVPAYNPYISPNIQIDPNTVISYPVHSVTAPSVTTLGPTNISYTGATFNGTINTHNYVSSVWFEINGSLKVYGMDTIKNSSVGNFSFKVSSLSDDTTYDYRMCAQSSQGTVCGSFVELKTSRASGSSHHSSGGGGGGGSTTVTANTLGSGKCPVTLVLFDRMKKGDHDGMYSTYNNKITTQVNLLQAHINRILSSQFTLAAGPVDGSFGPLTAQGVMRLQTMLNQSIIPSPHLVLDGIVGPYTLAAINNSCGLLEK